VISFRFSVQNDIGGGCTTIHQVDCVVSDIEEAIERGRESAVLIRAFSDAFTEEWESE
jgi:hypothetical protein